MKLQLLLFSRKGSMSQDFDLGFSFDFIKKNW